MEKQRDINTIIKEYRKDINLFKKGTYLGEKNYINVENGYDISELNEKHPLWEHVSKTIGGVPINKNKTYLDYAAVVFDDHSHNFHVFPEDKDTYRKLSQDFLELQIKLCEYIERENVKLPNGAILKKKSGGDYPFVRLEKIEELKKVSNDIRLSIELIDGEIKHHNLYHYVTLYHKDIYYTINFMRYIYDAKGIVGCTMRAIQFHKDTGKINLGGVCYPQTDKDFDFNTNNNGHICYNPPVEWPTAGSSWNDQIVEIIGRFLDFVDNNEKEGESFYKNSERNKKGYGREYLNGKSSQDNS